jgi:hypothetical protein
MTVQVPFTTTVTSHGLLIKTGKEVVGCISKFGPSMSRTVTPVFEFGSQTTGTGGDVSADAGEPYENVPGNISGTQINIERYDIYTARFERAFGTNDLVMLTRQDKPIQLIEFLAGPADNNLTFTTVYYGVWFTSLGRDYSADGDRIVKVSAQAMYTRKRSV